MSKLQSKPTFFRLLRAYLDLRGSSYLLLATLSAALSAINLGIVGRVVGGLAQGDWAGSMFLLLYLGISYTSLLLSDLLAIYLLASFTTSLRLRLRSQVEGYLLSWATPVRIEEAGGKGAIIPWFVEEVDTMTSSIISHLEIVVHLVNLTAITLLLSLTNIYLLPLTLLSLSLYMLIPYLLRGYGERLGERQLDNQREEYGVSLSLFNTLSLFVSNRKPLVFVREMVKTTKRYLKRGWRITNLESLFYGALNLVYGLFSLAFELAAGLLVYLNLIPLSTFVVVAGYFGMATGALEDIKAKLSGILSSRSLFRRLSSSKEGEGGQQLGDFEVLRLRDVGLNYGEREVFKGVSFELKRGEKMAIVGVSGSGKSSLIDLVTRQRGATMGEVSINGVNLQDLSPSDLIGKIVVLTDRGQIFEGSLAENIKLPNHNLSDEEVSGVLERVGLDYLELERGVDRGSLSKGEGQRVNLARALLSNCQLLILDEALNGVDSRQRELIEGLLLRDTNLTLIHITHTLTNPQLYGKIYHLEGCGGGRDG